MKFLSISLTLILFFTACKEKDTQTPDINNGLVAHFALDGNAVEAVSGKNGTNHNAQSTVNRHGQANKAMLFNRADEAYIDFGDIDTLSFTDNIFTFCFWAKVADTSKRIAVISKRGPTGPFEYSIDNFFGYDGFTFDNWKAPGGPTIYGIDPMQAKGNMQLDKWQHFAFTGDGSQIRVYVDGVLQSGIDAHNSGNFFDNTNAPVVIGNGGGWGGNYFFDGCIDDIYIYKKVLDADVISFLAKQ